MKMQKVRNDCKTMFSVESFNSSNILIVVSTFFSLKLGVNYILVLMLFSRLIGYDNILRYKDSYVVLTIYHFKRWISKNCIRCMFQDIIDKI